MVANGLLQLREQRRQVGLLRLAVVLNVRTNLTNGVPLGANRIAELVRINKLGNVIHLIRHGNERPRNIIRRRHRVCRRLQHLRTRHHIRIQQRFEPEAIVGQQFHVRRNRLFVMLQEFFDRR